ncbi:MAG: hypothetical protein JW915_05415 [Chitinispirillaceae bacterium]|nr:hypothetical protein [Chitinispirillaceae bacterium]
MLFKISKLTLFSAALILSCGPVDPEESCSPIDAAEAPRSIQITYPVAGDTLSLTNPAAVQFKFEKLVTYSDKVEIGAVLTIVKKNVEYQLTQGESLTVPVKGNFTCAEIPWTISNDRLALSENDIIAVTLKVYNYSETDVFHETGTFYIKR